MYIIWRTDECHLIVNIAHMLVSIESAVGSEKKTHSRLQGVAD
mgnify:CR=1 FL=1